MSFRMPREKITSDDDKDDGGGSDGKGKGKGRPSDRAIEHQESARNGETAYGLGMGSAVSALSTQK